MMNRFAGSVLAAVALLALASSAAVSIRFVTMQRNTNRSIESFDIRLKAAERQLRQGPQQPAVPATEGSAGDPAGSAQRSPGSPAHSAVAASMTATAQLPKVPTGPVLTNAMRDVVVTVEQCTLSTRTLRCSFTATNQAPAEKKFVLAVGGRWSRFEQDQGGASVFDDVGNDFLSAGGGIGNHAVENCDRSDPCVVEKILTPAVRTAGWLRFDAVDARASVIKLLRLKWSDGDAWTPMDFREIGIVTAPN